ncbi:MAG TPA: M10 family metallopeptidase C-terminal domain-containing protein [Rhizomicrobium sp.]|jgi:Ca2+-binding RTX toxin-like protein|nr:M10 family metallopeptidase C-terminal domain-containing protein [Rhizomicrobium sp.]
MRPRASLDSSALPQEIDRFSVFNAHSASFSDAEPIRPDTMALHYDAPETPIDASKAPLDHLFATDDIFDFRQTFASDDQITSPTRAQEVAFISGVNANGSVASRSFATWQGSEPATYHGPAGVAKFGSPLAHTGGGNIKFYFDTASHWTATEKSVMSDCLALWSNLANVKFAMVTKASNAQITFVRGSDGGAYTTPQYSGAAGAGKIGGKTLNTMTHATISLDTSVPGFGPIDGKFGTIGGYVWETILHEEGHALGLGHAGPYNGDVNTKTQQFGVYDTRLWAIMSYIEPAESAKYSSQYPVKGTDWGVSNDGYGNDPTTPMPLDILAMQSLYGAPVKTEFSGGQTFGFDSNIKGAIGKFYDFTVNSNPVLTIWDEGKQNTLNLSGFDSASKVNLNPGTFSSCDGKVNNIGVALGTTINTAITGGGNDVIVGGNANNIIQSTGGNDRLMGGAGSDHLIGGSGSDRLTGGSGADRLSGGGGADIFIYTKVTDSRSIAFDKIVKLDGSADKFDLWFHVSGTVRIVNGGTLDSAHFDAPMERILSAARLPAHHAALFSPAHGDEAGHTFLVIDANGHAGYQAGADLVIDVTGGTHLHDIHADSFI